MPLSPGAEHDLHLAGGRLARVEHRSAPGARPRRRATRASGRRSSPGRCDRRRPSRRLALARLLGDDAHAEAHQRLAVVGELAVGGDDQDLADLLAERGLDTHDAVSAARAACRRARAARASRGRARRGSAAAPGSATRSAGVTNDGRPPGSARRLRSGPRSGRARHRLALEVLDVGVAGGVALHDAHAEPERDGAAGGLEDALVVAVAAGGAVLEEQVRVVAAAASAISSSLRAISWSMGWLPPGAKGAAYRVLMSAL